MFIFLDGQAIFKKTYAVSNDRTILVSPLEPGKTYITYLIAGDGIRAETKSDPQMVTTLGKGTTVFDLISPENLYCELEAPDARERPDMIIDYVTEHA